MALRERRPPETLLARAALFRALARGFGYPQPGHRAELLRALAGLPAARRLSWLKRVRAAWARARDCDLAADYTRLFLTAARCPLHETAYGDARRMAGRAAELADIAGFYSAFGLQLSQADPDLPDHICAEIEFYSLLLVKQAYAQSRSRLIQLRVTEKAARLFLGSHLGRWVRALAQAIAEQSPSSPYRELAQAVRAAVGEECRHLRIRPVPLEGRLPFDEMQAETFTCPLASASPSVY